jgi:hypothetical protein
MELGDNAPRRGAAGRLTPVGGPPSPRYPGLFPPHVHDSPFLANTPNTNNNRPVFSTSGHPYWWLSPAK